jgi:hypothetical protein
MPSDSTGTEGLIVIFLKRSAGHPSIEVFRSCWGLGYKSEPTRIQIPNISPEKRPHRTPYTLIQIFKYLFSFNYLIIQ